MKISRKILCIGIGALCAVASAMLAQAQEDDGHLLNLYKLHVKIGHDSEFRDAMAAWKSCYLENDGEAGWGVWRRVQGEGSVYTISFNTPNWADMDSEDPAGQACQSVIRDRIDPNLSGVTTMVARYMPETSGNASDYGVVEVYSFDVDDLRAFNDVIKAVTDVMGEDGHGNSGHWYDVRGGGPGVEDYFVVSTYKNFAAMDEDRPGVWERYEKVHGEAATEAIREKFGDSLDRSWSYIYSRIDGLSHRASE
ncbi:MAG: hypothetical protein RQ741_05595 [Wenzhouxiangellaceae bacterium]|nr:hypothetical protein [Wenzhouxiangellaceae bacterium]